MNNKGYIYLITNLINGKKYVGQTINDVETRMRSHRQFAKSYLRDKSKKTLFIDKAISKYGWENFKVDVLEECCQDQLNDREIYWISELNTLDDKIGYNVSPGGGNSAGHTDETKELIRQSSLDRVWITNGIENHFYKPGNAEKFLNKNADWSYGKAKSEFSDPEIRSQTISDKTKGLISITNGIIMTRINPSKLEDYIKLGFNLGTLKNGKPIYRYYITNGYKEYLVSDTKLDNYLDRGYVKGKLCDLTDDELFNVQQNYDQHIAQVRNAATQKAAEARLGKHHSKETKKKISDTLKTFNSSDEGKEVKERASSKKRGKPGANKGKKIPKTQKLLESYAKKKGKIFVTDGVRDYSINPEDLEFKLSQGFTQGRHVNNSVNTIWVNDGIKNCRIQTELLEKYISEGYSQGKLGTRDIHIYCVDAEGNFLAQFLQLKDAADWWLENGYGVDLKRSFYAIPKIKESADNNIIIKDKQWIYGDYGK